MLEVRALRFADTAVAALYTTGSATGMVVDIGACETRVSTIVEGVQIGNARFNVHGLGAENVLDELSREMEEEGAMQANRDDLEEMLVQTFRSAAGRPVRSCTRTREGYYRLLDGARQPGDGSGKSAV